MSEILPPFNLKAWLSENMAVLRPPVCNKTIFHTEDFIVMVVGGPNQRKDYHFNEGAEIFYQIKGAMQLKLINNSKFKSITIAEGEIFQLPGRILHSPQRFADTLGVVVELKRQANQLDGLAWYCDSCQNLLHQEFFHLNDIENDLPKAITNFKNDINQRTCKKCAQVLEV